MKRTIAVDFDGVLHAYSKKWHDGTIYDAPVPGAKVAMQKLLDCGYDVVIYSVRCHDRLVRGKREYNQRDEMAAWLAKYEIPYSRIHDTAGKPLCKLFIDDNAYRFEGDWNKALLDVSNIL